MKKGHRTVFQNAWSQKNQHFHWKNKSASKKLTNSYEKGAQKRLPKCLKPQKTNAHWKNNSVSILLNSYEKRPRNHLPKCLKPKKQTLSLKKTILFQKSFQIHMKKGHRPVFQNAWSQKKKHSLWKSNTD